MDKLIQFIESRYNMARNYCAGDSENLTRLLNQAFGALEFYHWQNPDQFEEVERLWNEEWHGKFLALY